MAKAKTPTKKTSYPDEYWDNDRRPVSDDFKPTEVYEDLNKRLDTELDRRDKKK